MVILNADSTETYTIERPENYLNKPDVFISENNSNYYQLTIINNNAQNVKVFIKPSTQSNYGQSIATLLQNQQTIYKTNWKNNETTITYNVMFIEENLTPLTSETTITINKQSTNGLNAPTITNNSSNNQYYTLNISNSNNETVNLYINQEFITSINANQITTYTKNWKNDEEKTTLILYFTSTKDNNIKSETTTINLTKTINSGNYEIIDINGLILTIITMPFSFLSQAFNFTLFAGTPYAINVSQLILGMLGTIIAVYIIVWIINKIRK